MKAWSGRRETPGKVLKDRRSPRGRGRMGTSVRRTRLGSASTTIHTSSRKQSGIRGPTMFCSYSFGTSHSGIDAAEPGGRSSVSHCSSTSRPSPEHPLLKTSGTFSCSVRNALTLRYSLFAMTDAAALVARDVWTFVSSVLLLRPPRQLGGERRRQKSLRIDVHHADGVVWEPVYDRTRLRRRGAVARVSSI